MTVRNDPAPDALRRFTQILRAGRTSRVSTERLWEAFGRAFPHRGTGPAERQRLLDALRALARQGVLRLPSERGARWDRSVSPAVPTSVDLVRQPPQRDARDWRRYPWHEALRWVRELRSPSRSQLDFLFRVQRGLVEGSFTGPAPMKYRSLQLTDDEKRLAQLTKTSLFGPGRLTLELLGCMVEMTPLAWESVGESPRLVIFENGGPFAVARLVLQRMRPPPFGMVAYGGGRSIVASLGHLQTVGRPLERVEYVGDIDVAGLDIARAARARAAALGLPDIRHAHALLRAMLDAAATFGHPHGWRASGRKPAPSRIEDLVRGLPRDLREQIADILISGARIPEEVLGQRELVSAFLNSGA